MKNVIFPLLIAVIGTSCGAVDSAKEKATTSLTESIIEKATGEKVGMPDASNVEKNKVHVKLKIGDEDLESKFNGAFGSITGSKETIAITAQLDKDNTMYSVVFGFTAPDLTTIKPIIGSVNSKNESEPKFTFAVSTFSETGVESMISNEAVGEIISLNDQKAVIKIKGKISEAQYTNEPSKWKAIEGTVELEYPVFTTVGVDKKDLEY